MAEDKSCTFEQIVLAILAAARQVIRDRVPRADRIAIWNDKHRRETESNGLNNHSPIFSIDLIGSPTIEEIMVWYGTRVWHCAKIYQLIERNGMQTLILKEEKECAKRPEYRDQEAVVPEDHDWQRLAIQRLVRKSLTVLIASSEHTGSHDQFKGYLLLRKRKLINSP